MTEAQRFTVVLFYSFLALFVLSFGLGMGFWPSPYSTVHWEAIGWALFAGVATVPLWKMLTGLIEWEGPGGKLTIGGTTAVTILTFGALAYGVGAGAGGLAGIGKAAGILTTPPVGTPNAPSITATVYRDQGDSLWVDGGTFAGSGVDTHDSTYIKVDSTGGGKAYHLDTIGAQERDSVGGNINAFAPDSGAVVDVIMKYKGAEGGWSDPDTLTGVTMVASAFDHEPAGASVLFDFDGSDPSPAAYDDYFTYDADWAANVTAVSAPNNPRGTGNALESVTPVGDRFPGLATADSFPGGAVDTLHIRFDVKFSSNYETHGIKLFYLGSEGGSNTSFYLTRESNGRIDLTNQNAGSIDVLRSTNTLTLDTWHTLEILLSGETSVSANDGTAEAWLDGTAFGAGTPGTYDDGSPQAGVDWGSTTGFNGIQFRLFADDANTVQDTVWQTLYMSGKR